MKTRQRIGSLSAAFFGLAVLLAWTSASADIYTWTDANGKLNLSNRPPPADARITSVYREDPAVRASADAAQAAARAEELKALNERVAQLERDLDTASRQPPAPPVVYTLPAAPPVYYPPVIAQTIVVPSAPAYSDCAGSWGDCSFAGNFGWYPGGFVVVGAPASHRGPLHRGSHGRPPPAGRAPPLPVGAIPDPVNLFPGSHHR